MRTILVRELLRRVSVNLQDIDPQFTGYPEREMVDALNDGASAIATYIPPMVTRIDAIKLKAGTQQSIQTIAAADCKPGDGSTPASPIYGKQFLRPICQMGATGLTPGDAIRMGDMKQMDSQTPNWHALTGPVRIVFYDPTSPLYFWVSRGAPDNSTWIRIAYTAHPDKIPNTGTPGAELYGMGGTNATVIPVDDECLDPLVAYITARCLMKPMPGRPTGNAGDWVAMFTGWINSKAAVLTGANPNLKRLPMAPEPIAAAS